MKTSYDYEKEFLRSIEETEELLQILKNMVTDNKAFQIHKSGDYSNYQELVTNLEESSDGISQVIKSVEDIITEYDNIYQTGQAVCDVL